MTGGAALGAETSAPEQPIVTVAPSPSAAEGFVQRLLATVDERRRRALLARHRLTPEELKEAVLLLVAGAERLVGADPRRMEQVCLDTLALAEQAGDDFSWAMARMRYGDALRARGRHAEALTCYDEAAAAFRRLDRPVEAARTRIGWISSTASLGRPKEALAAGRVAQRVLAAHGETLRAAIVESSLGIIQVGQGRYRAALRSYKTASGLYKLLGESGRLHLARCQHNQGLTLTRLGRHREALISLESARDAYQQLGETAGAARVSRSIAERHIELGQYSLALRALKEAGIAFRTLDLSSEAVSVARTAADCYLSLNRPKDALTVLDEAMTGETDTIDPQQRFEIATRRIVAHMMQGQRAVALSLLDGAERTFQDGALHHRAWLATQRAATLLREGLPEEAAEAAERAQAMARAAGMSRLRADALINQGVADLALGKVKEAGHAAARAHRLARTVDAAPLLNRAHELRARVAETQSKPALARRHYAAAIDQLEREQQGVIFEFRDSFALDRGLAYERLAVLQQRAGNAAGALATAERVKSRALADAVAGTIQIRPRGSAEARRAVRELTEAREAYAAASYATRSGGETGENAGVREDNRRALEQRIADLTHRLQLAGATGREVADLYGAVPHARLPKPPDGTALIEFFFSGEDILRFVVDKTGIRSEMLAGAVPEVERLLRAFRLNLDATELGTPSERGRLAAQARRVLARLEVALLGGIGDMARYQSLVIVPHGLLHYLPFHALHDGERYLIERFAISYAPSAALYEICRARAPRRTGRGALVLAHSADGRLPFSVREGAAVGKVLNAPLHAESAATRNLLETDGRRAGLIHIAAHGEFRPDAPLFSCIELAGGPLTTADVFNLSLRASLVTLSACETGRAVLSGGDELAGLTRAFLYAGAAGLLVSQWRVDDASTAELMVRLYENLARGTPTAHALRAAQRAAIAGEICENGGGHPFFWAGFQLTGDGERSVRRLTEAWERQQQ